MNRDTPATCAFVLRDTLEPIAPSKPTHALQILVEMEQHVGAPETDFDAVVNPGLEEIDAK